MTSQPNTTSPKNSNRIFTTKQIVIIGMLSALSYILMLIHFPVKYMGFLEIEFSDIPAIVASLSFGPVTTSTTGGSGEIANFIVGVGYVLPLGLIFHKTKTKYKTLLSCTVGTICMVLTGIVINYFITVPLYAALFGGEEAVIGACASVIPAIKNIGTVVILGITPFNIVKGILISVLGVLCYKGVGKYIK